MWKYFTNFSSKIQFWSIFAIEIWGLAWIFIFTMKNCYLTSFFLDVNYEVTQNSRELRLKVRMSFYNIQVGDNVFKSEL